MSTGYGWEGLMQVYATLLGARYVPGRLCGGIVWECYNKLTFTFLPYPLTSLHWDSAPREERG